MVLVPRLASGLLGEAGQPLIEPARWADTRVSLPAETPALRGLFPGAAIPSGQRELLVSEALATFPVGLFHGA
ncbi:MAG: hypothetical protein A2002_08565 [Pseudomonadales bacterium GWC1_66_9]|nr:MAG: hypothetical protein A2002_08565 [Pseudomonadales bacterium GWC1_66_9]